MSLHILLFAAGASSRMGGRDKLMEPVAPGLPLLEQSVRRALATGLEVLVVLPPDRPARNTLIEALGLPPVLSPRARDGMAQSIKAGLSALPASATGAMMLMADMPDLDTADLLTLAAAFEAEGATKVIRAATEDGTPGSPTLVPRALFPRLMALDGDTGGRAALKDAPKRLVRLPGQRALTDLDTPADWAAWRDRAPS